MVATASETLASLSEPTTSAAPPTTPTSGNLKISPSNTNTNATSWESWLAQLPVSQMTVTLYIPTICVGAVIGRRGTTIASIQKQAQLPNAPQVRVSVVGHTSSSSGGSGGTGSTTEEAKNCLLPTSTSAPAGKGSSSAGQISSMMDSNADTDTAADDTAAAAAVTNPPTSSNTSSVPYTHTPLDFSDPQWTPVVIRADPVAAWTVAHKLGGLCNGLLQDTIVDVPIPRQKHASIVGKRGLTLQHASAHSHCRIWVPPKEFKLDLLQLEGQLENCELCLKALNEILLHQDNASGGSTTNSATGTPRKGSNKAGNPPPGVGTSTGGTSTTQPNQQQNSFYASFSHQAQLIVPQLPSQTKFRNVGRKTDTIIKKKKVDDNWILTVLGSNEAQVQNAHGMLSKWAEQQQTATIASSSSNSESGDQRTATTITANNPPTIIPTSPTLSASGSTNNNANLSPRAAKHHSAGGGRSGGRGGPGRGRGRKGKPRGGRGSGSAGTAPGNNSNNPNPQPGGAME